MYVLHYHTRNVADLTSRGLRRTLNKPSATSQLVLDAFNQLCEADPAPVYLQIERCIRLLVADGALRPGQRLPSVRALAEQLGLAANTVARAYAALAGDGIVDSRAGAGSVVADRLPASAAEPDRPGRERLQRVARHRESAWPQCWHSPNHCLTHASFASARVRTPCRCRWRRSPMRCWRTSSTASRWRSSTARRGGSWCPAARAIRV